MRPPSAYLIVVAIFVVVALLLAVPGLGLGGPVIHYPPSCPPNCYELADGSRSCARKALALAASTTSPFVS